jgi:hypothetical protein
LRVEPRVRPEGSIANDMNEEGFVTGSPREEAELVVVSPARCQGRVVTSLPGVSVAGLRVSFKATKPGGSCRSLDNTDPEGRFSFESMEEGMVNVFVRGQGEDQDWTYRIARDVALKRGRTTSVDIELIRGVEVEGKVVAQGTGRPLQGTEVTYDGPSRPLDGQSPFPVTTDAQGRYHFRLPPGETRFSVLVHQPGERRYYDEKSAQTVTIPAEAARFEVPPIVLAPQ